MTRHIKANRRYRVMIDILINGEDELVIVAPDEAEGEDMAQRLIDTGIYTDLLTEIKRKDWNIDVSIASIEDIGNAITGE